MRFVNHLIYVFIVMSLLVTGQAGAATWALNAAVCDFRFLAIMTLFLDSQVA